MTEARIARGTVAIQVVMNDEAGDAELTAIDACGSIIAADTFREPMNALMAVDKLREMYPDHTVKFGR